MSKTKRATVADYKHITPEIEKKVKTVLGEAGKHTYSVSRIYDAHNAVFQLREVAQACSSCLRNRVRNLRNWAHEYYKIEGPIDHGEAPATSESRYRAVVKRLGLELGDTWVGELATLNTVLEEGYPFKLTDDEIDAVLTRAGLLEKILHAPNPDLTIDGLPAAAEQYLDPSGDGFVAPAKGVVRYPMGEDAIPIDFTPNPEMPNKGTVLKADGSKVLPGTYLTATGHIIAVQPGSKATIKEEDLS